MKIKLVHVGDGNWTAIVVVKSQPENFIPICFSYFFYEIKEDLRNRIFRENSPNRADMRAGNTLVNVFMHQLVN